MKNMASAELKDIIEYYDEAEVSYRDVWHLDTCLALHYGFWEKDVKNLKQALLKENEVLAEMLGIKAEHVVLDAGCGVGGSSIFLSKHIGCQTFGVTVSPPQKQKADIAAEKHGVSDLTSFSVTNYNSTHFKDNTFDVIWFLESFGYTEDVPGLLQEMYRVLKPGGKIMITEGLTPNRDLNPKEEKIMYNWLNGWALNGMMKQGVLREHLVQSNFHSIQMTDCTKKVRRSSLILYLYAKLALIYGSLCKLVGKKYGNEITIKNTVGTKYQYIALRKGLWKYFVTIAQKK